MSSRQYRSFQGAWLRSGCLIKSDQTLQGRVRRKQKHKTVWAAQPHHGNKSGPKEKLQHLANCCWEALENPCSRDGSCIRRRSQTHCSALDPSRFPGSRSTESTTESCDSASALAASVYAPHITPKETTRDPFRFKHHFRKPPWAKINDNKSSWREAIAGFSGQIWWKLIANRLCSVLSHPDSPCTSKLQLSHVQFPFDALKSQMSW